MLFPRRFPKASTSNYAFWVPKTFFGYFGGPLSLTQNSNLITKNFFVFPFPVTFHKFFVLFCCFVPFFFPLFGGVSPPMFCFGGVVVYCRTLASTGSGKTRAAELF
jgi:hypothetical protein